ncbi:hypothetical protein NDU88_001981 [Pleurodeles waltl]|uniref:Uncharacterized protein n=1 Tax=Pleurodeles waltl TaxID=8319 RepID=A0AAV7S947_PLEWA|nr:hypothetical protein NDU88_001981 [Pleurodeles waltl]
MVIMSAQKYEADQAGGWTSGFGREEDANKACRGRSIPGVESGEKEEAQPHADEKEKKPVDASEVEQTPEIWYEEEWWTPPPDSLQQPATAQKDCGRCGV